MNKLILIAVPWACTVGLLGASYFFWSGQKAAQAELHRVMEDHDRFVAAVEEERLEAAAAHQTELERLRRETRDLLKLRNEINQLRQEKDRWVQEKERWAQEALQTEELRAQLQLLQGQIENQVRAAAAGIQQAGDELRVPLRIRQLFGEADMDPGTACIHNLRQIDGAKDQWALEAAQVAGAEVSARQLAEYLRGGFPSCPQGGAYSVNLIGEVPACSIPGHSLE